MSQPLLYIFDPEDPHEDFIQLSYEKSENEYVIEDYVFLAAAKGDSLSISSRLDVRSLKYFVGIKEGGIQKIALSGCKSSKESGDPIIVYTNRGGESYQITIKI